MCYGKKNCFAFLFWGLTFITASGLFAQDIKFKHLSINEGLSQSPIFSIYQDSRGLIWIGSRDGLIRYDGYEFKTYYNDDYDSNTNNHRDIYSIIEDNKGNLWIGTPSGLTMFNRDTEKFTYLPQLKKGTVYQLLSPDHHHLWIATQAGLFYSNNLLPNTGKPSFKEILPSRINAVFIDRNKLVWAGLKNGISCLDTSGRVITLPPVLKNNSLLASAKVVVIKQDKDGAIWLGTENNGIFEYDPSTETCINYKHEVSGDESIPENFIKDIYIHSNNSIWIATRSGLSIFNKQRKKFANYQHHSDDVNSLSNNAIWNIMADRSGSIWLTTYAGGINIYNPVNANFLNIGERIGQHPGLSHPVVTSIADNRNGGLWIGTDGGGLNYMDTKTGRFSYYHPMDKPGGRSGNIVLALALSKQGRLWLGTLDGLASLEPGATSFSYLNLDIKKRKVRVDALLNDEHGMWVGTDIDGLKFIDEDQNIHTYTRAEKQVSSNHINALLKDDEGNIWIGTSAGLNYYHKAGKRFMAYTNRKSNQLFNSNDVLSLFQDSRSAIWVGTRSGLFLFDRQRREFYPIIKKDDAKNSVIKAITEDKEGNLWFSTNRGIAKLSLRKHTGPISQVDYDVHTYTSADGLSSNQFLSNAVCNSVSGNILFGGVNGITAFNPQKIIKSQEKVKVIITDFQIYSKPVNFNTQNSPLTQPIEETRSITLNYDQAYITFKFAGLNYINPSNNQYAYKLDGLASDNWHYSGKQRIASYTNLDAGDYTFRVKAVSNDGTWNNEDTSIRIKVLPPFWRTWWAYTLYVLFTGTALYLIIRFFKIKARLERDLYFEHLEYERQEELHQTKLNFFTNISHEIRTPLTLIAGPLEKLITENADRPELNGQLIQINNNTGRLLRLVNELMDFRKADSGNLKLRIGKYDIVAFANEIYLAFKHQAINRGISYYFQSSSAVIELYYDVHELEKAVFNLLSNAFKFIPDGGTILLKITENKDNVELSITDNGKGIPYADQAKLFTNFYQVGGHEMKNVGSGIGLALSKSIVEQHHGTISVSSKPAEKDQEGSTRFCICLKRGHLHYSDDLLVETATYEIHLNDPVNHNPAPDPNANAAKPEGEKKDLMLVVEDNSEVRDFLKRSLSGQYQIIESANGVEGWQTAIDQIPDLIISDVMMPEMDGITLCRMLKQDERTNHIPVILLTARAAYIHQVDGLATGADAYVIKPFHMQVLELNIRNLLAARTTMRQKFSQQITLQPRDIVIDSADEKFLDKLMKIIEAHIQDPDFGVDQLASEIGMSQSVLYRKIKALADLTVADFVKTTRLKKAAMLLARNELSIADVAFMVGFNNRKHFSKEFKKQFGQNPTTYTNSADAVKITKPVLS